ncbi:MAG: phenylacetic acid degradation operon negative regulatory protein [Cellvibrionaceae bacterium]|jgi:phenylacetic acid degradation operon negative regulatory protein
MKTAGSPVILCPMLSDLQTVTRTKGSTQFYVFNLFADYILPYKNGWAWTHELLYLLDLLDVSDRAARTTLSRMKQQGWFDTVKDGRRSRYEITDKGRAIIAEGDKRIFETPIDNWDGGWQFAIYSLPEDKRPLRNELRKKLVWFGFGNLAPGTWVGAHNRLAELEKIVGEMGISSQVSLINGQRVGLMTDDEIVAKCWDLDQLEAEYAAFVGRWKARLEGLDIANMSAEERFRTRFMLTFEFQPFPRKDPNLPTVLLPENWSGYAARRLFTAYRLKLNEGLPAFFADIA